MQKFIAIALPDAQFFYLRSSAIVVPAASAEKIAAALNAAKYQIKPGEKWHVYESESIDNYINKQIKTYRTGRNIKVYTRG